MPNVIYMKMNAVDTPWVPFDLDISHQGFHC